MNKSNFKRNQKLYEIPYIVHKKRMYEAYKRETILKVLLILSNLFWLILTVVRWFYV
jgi:hypothetical protein